MGYDRSQIEQKVKEIITTRLGTRPEEITPEADISKDLGADSLDFAEIIIELEEAFGIELPLVDAEEQEPEDICKVGELVNLITAKAA